MSRTKKNRILPLVLSLVLLVAVTVVVLVWVNFGTIKDYFVGINYQPTQGMVAIRDMLPLTERGVFIFNASQPVLNERGDFNRNCRGADTETAILGCYRDDRIYIYNIVDEELTGIRELTTAHELLHAVYARMSGVERERLRTTLKEAYLANLDVLQEEVENYGEDEQVEEMYVRLGTEVKDLPEELERHFAKIFTDQDKVVDYYDGYITVFQEIERRLAELSRQLDVARGEIDVKSAEYERRTAQLSADIISFNACAEVAGCFESEEVFSRRRAGLVAERDALTLMYEELNMMINEYNLQVEEYNENVMHGRVLNSVINSAVEPAGI